MDRKDFLKKGLLGTGMFITANSFGNIIKNDIDDWALHILYREWSLNEEGHYNYKI